MYRSDPDQLDADSVWWLQHAASLQSATGCNEQDPERRRSVGALLHCRVRESGSPGTELRAWPTSFVGRDVEAQTIERLLDPASSSTRLLTLLGTGGVGKTRLAVRVATNLQGTFTDGARLVELAGLADEALVTQVVASSVGLLHADHSSLLDALLAMLAPRATLLVLDNCEHLIDACARLAEQLLAGCPNLRILATSREPLGLPGEQHWRVAPLETPSARDLSRPDSLTSCPAVRLFVERARSVDPHFALSDENAAIVAHICTRLEGIPLGLELAAARVRVLSVGEILERLDDCLRLLTGGSRAQPTRQQTMAATLNWSYSLLTEPEQVLFRRLAVFRGGCTLELAETVCADSADVDSLVPPNEVLDLLTRLADRSLVVADRRERTTRYYLLEPVRQYAQRCLEAAGEAVPTSDRHRAALTALAEAAEAQLRGSDQVAWLRRLEREQDNLRAALHWAEARGDGDWLLRQAGALAGFWETHGHMSEGRRWLNAALDRPFDVGLTASARTKALLGAGELAFYTNDFVDAERRNRACLNLARQSEDRTGIAAALVGLGMAYRLGRDTERSRQFLEKAIALQGELGDRAGRAYAWLNLGVTLWDRGHGDLAGSRRVLEQALTYYRDAQDSRRVAIAQALLGRTILAQGDQRRAAELLAEALAGHVLVGDRFFVFYDLLGLAAVLAAEARPTEAARLLGAAWALGNVPGDALTDAAARKYGPVIDTVRGQLDAAAFGRAWTEGQGMSLDQAVHHALTAGEPEPTPTADLRTPASPRAADVLTAREREVAALIGQGYRTDQQLAERLTISPATAGVHVRNVREKLGFHSRWQIADWAQAQGLPNH